MTLKKRIDRLTPKNCCPNGPTVVFICKAGGEAHAALVRGGGGVSRDPYEIEANFKQRSCNAAAADALHDDGRNST